MNAGNTHSSSQRNASNATRESHTVKALAMTLTISLSEVISYGMPIIYCLTLSQSHVCVCMCWSSSSHESRSHTCI